MCRKQGDADEGIPSSGPVTGSDNLEPALTPILPEICGIPLDPGVRRAGRLYWAQWRWRASCRSESVAEGDLFPKPKRASGSPHLAEGSRGRLSPWNTPAFSAPGGVATSQEEGTAVLSGMLAIPGGARRQVRVTFIPAESRGCAERKNSRPSSCSAPNPWPLHVGLLTQRMCGSFDTPAPMPNVTPGESQVGRGWGIERCPMSGARIERACGAGVFHSQKQMWGRRLSGLLPRLQRRTASDGSPFVRLTGTPANNQIPGRNHASQPTPQVRASSDGSCRFSPVDALRFRARVYSQLYT